MCPKECAWENKPHEKCNLKKRIWGRRERERPTKAIFFLRDDLIFRKTL
jgi:hypothetical protein